MNILVSSASDRGATQDIGNAVGTALRDRGLTVEVIAPDAVGSIAAYDAVIIGSAIYTGHWRGSAISFCKRFSAELRHRPVWLFSSGPVGDPSRKLVQKMMADPVELAHVRKLTGARGHEIFGKLTKTSLTRPQRTALIAFRGMERNFRDWTAVERWADEIAAALRIEADSGADAAAPVPPGPVTA